ncbi:hypothetical protein LguiA_007094 [Lonicera macranthoides]
MAYKRNTLKDALPSASGSYEEEHSSSASTDASSKDEKPQNKSKQLQEDSKCKPSEEEDSESDEGAKEEKSSRVDKKSAITLLWTDKDEVTVLNGMIRYKLEKGLDPFADFHAFHEFVKDSLRDDVSKNQLTDKIRRLEKKYQNNAEK